MSTLRAAVVGAGLGGLSAAMRLAAEGWEVVVFEKQAGPGGKAFTEEIGGYRFDTGPSLLTLAPVFEELFGSTGARLEDYLRIERLETICRYVYPDGTRLNAYADTDRFAAELEEKTGEPAGRITEYLAYSKRIYEITGELFLRSSLHDGATYRSKRFFKSLFQLGRIDALRTMDAAHQSFFDSPKVRQLFNRYATYNGSSPYKTPATLNIIPWVEYGLGAWAVLDGIYAIPKAMERRAREIGVTFRYDTQVTRILTRGEAGRNGEVRGVEVAPARGAGPDPSRAAREARSGAPGDGPAGARPRETGAPGAADRPQETGAPGAADRQELDFDIVVCDADVKPTYRYLLNDPEAPLLKRYERLEPSSSGLVFYWGVRRSFEELGLHNIFFSSDYQREFREIFDEGVPPTDPTIYLNITSKHTPADAPRGCENWFVLINAPPDRGQDWETEADRVRRRVIERLSAELGVDLDSLIEAEGRLLPPEIEARTDSHAGSLYGISSNTRLAAFLRHPNRSPRYRGLYHCGGSAHPGGGMPLVVLSGMISADLIARDLGKRPLQKAHQLG